MNKPIIYLTIVFGGFLLGGCKARNATLEESFETRPLLGKEIPIKNVLFANPKSIEIVDTIMLFVDKFNDKYFTAIDLKNHVSINRFGIDGRGPNELSYPGDLFYNKRENLVSFRLRNPTRYWSLNIEDLTKHGITFSERVNLKFEKSTAGFLTFVPILNSNGKYIGTGRFHDGMYGICQSNGILDTVIGSYTIAEEHKGIDQYMLGSGYQGLIKPHPSKAFVAYASARHDLLEVINCRNDDYKIKRFHGGNYPILSVGEDVGMLLSRHHPLSFIDLCTTENYLYAIYSGKSFAESGLATANCNLLYVFDWDLNPIICYELDYEITAIKVTEDDQQLYSFALNKDDKMTLIQWRLNHK